MEKDVKHNPMPPPAPPVAPAPPQPVSHVAASGRTTIGKSMKISGEIVSAEELYLDGEVEGKIETSERLSVGPNGKINAGIKAREVIVFGSVKGNVEAAEKIAIRAGANIIGDIKTAGITIEDGAYFKGGIDIMRPAAGKPSASATE